MLASRLPVLVLLSVPLVDAVASSAAISSTPIINAPTPSEWHRQRRLAILRDHPEVKGLIGKESLTLPLLAGVNVAQVGCAIAVSHLPSEVHVPLAIFVGGTLSLWQFTLLHDVLHNTAALPAGVRRNDVLFAGSLPSLFGYFLYLRYGHLTHHKDFGTTPLSTLFNSEQTDFEDGDALFVAHRQQMSGDLAGERPGFFGKKDVGGVGLSISRTIYSNLWLGDATSSGGRRLVHSVGEMATAVAVASKTALGTAIPGVAEPVERLSAPARFDNGVAMYHAAIFAFSMTFERAALVVGGAIVPALLGRNFFFPHKPDAFHQTCTGYARASMGLALLLVLIGGPPTLTWLFWAEVGWQLPIHPASAMFVSNHPSLEATSGGEGGSVAGCQPTASLYLGGSRGEWYDWICCYSNYHTEHHDFPDVPAFRLRQLRDLAEPYYSDEALAGCRDGWWETMRRTFASCDFYACSGVGGGEAAVGSVKLEEARIRGR